MILRYLTPTHPRTYTPTDRTIRSHHPATSPTPTYPAFPNSWTEGAMEFVLYKMSWMIIFFVNLTAVTMSFTSPWGARDALSTPHYRFVLVILWVSAFLANIIVTDIATEYACTLIGAMRCNNRQRSERFTPVPPSPPSKEYPPYIIVYCLKSKVSSDIHDILSYMRKSWMNNADYPNAVYLVLSGTSDPPLYAEEARAIKDWNKKHAEVGMVCKYLRRRRSILFKYGQYLDLMMLINGHDGTGGDKAVALYKNDLPVDGIGCFDPSTDITSFKGHLEYDRLVILDKDNVMGEDFLTKANSVFNNSAKDVDIIQPTIMPHDIKTRRRDGSDTIYASIQIASHGLGIKMEPFRQDVYPTATFFGKGIIRRTKYNEMLLGYNDETRTTQEDTRLPR